MATHAPAEGETNGPDTNMPPTDTHAPTAEGGTPATETPQETAPQAPVPAVASSDNGVEPASAPPAAAAAAAADTTDGTGAAAAAATAAAEEASRKRRSRWAPAPAEGSSAGASAASADGAPAKKSRWASKPAAVDPVANVLSQLTQEQLEAFKIQLRIDEITRAILAPQQALAERDAGGRPRSPSPEPIYDPNSGQRLNTRPVRFVKQLERERQELIESLQRANPAYKPPAGFKKIKYERRLLIPIKEYPDYNFIGMIIGPRGLTQKRMEKESGCKIVIRGKGSTKEGRANHRPQPGDDDDLHVLIQGDNEAAVIATTKEVEKLLVPIDETKNEHKARQLRELAVINGTLRDEIICRLCGLPGHRQIQCPNRSQSWQPANIRCQICNSDLHPTADCPQRFTRTADQAKQEMNDEYSSFMEEIIGGGPVAQRSAQPLYLTDGGQGGGGPPSGGERGDQQQSNSGPSPSGPPSAGGSGFIHPDRLTSRGDPAANYNRDGGSRVVKGQDGSAYREFRAPANALPHLPAVSHRDGFRDAPQQQYHQQPPPPPPQHGYGGGYQQHQPRYDAPYGGGGGYHQQPAYGGGGGGYAPGRDPSQYPPPHYVPGGPPPPPPPHYPPPYAPGQGDPRYPPPQQNYHAAPPPPPGAY